MRQFFQRQGCNFWIGGTELIPPNGVKFRPMSASSGNWTVHGPGGLGENPFRDREWTYTNIKHEGDTENVAIPPPPPTMQIGAPLRPKEKTRFCRPELLGANAYVADNGTGQPVATFPWMGGSRT